MTAAWHQYAEQVVAGEVPAGNLIRLSCERHLRDLEAADDRGLYFDEAAADKVVKFFSFLRHSKGRWGGEAFELAPWQQFVLACVFGWKRSDGRRRFRIGYCEVPRKNGKSTLSAGIGLYLMIADREPGAEVYAAATTRDQAKICWEEAKRMVQSSPSIRRRVAVTRNNLAVLSTNSKFEPLAADADNLDGLNVHGAIVDELHAHKSRDLWDVLDTATGAREQSLIFAITTAGNNLQSVCWEQREYARKILERVFEDDKYFAFIACPDEGDDPYEPAAWAKANPSFGVTVTEEYMAEKAHTAKHNPAAASGFKQKHLDIWVSKVIDQAIPREKWKALQQPFDWDSLLGRQCWIGLDLSSTCDLTALAAVFREQIEPGRYRFIVKSMIWIPELTVLERSSRDRVPYDVWVDQGWMETTPGAATDYDAIRQAINELGSQYEVVEIAVDHLFQGQWLAGALADDGFEVVAHRQGFVSMAIPTKQLIEAIANRAIVVDESPVMAWMADNLALEIDSAGNQKPSKRRSPDKIDGMVSLTMALGRAHVEDTHGSSVYEQRGVLEL